jgi:hypothetical protein
MNEHWMTVIGAWGDTLASYGNICKYCRDHNIEKTNIVYYGLHPEVIGFLKQQKYIDKVSHLYLSEPVKTENGLNPKSFFDFLQSMELVVKNFDGWMQATRLKEQIPDLIPTFVGYHYLYEDPHDCNRDFEVKLPSTETDWTSFKQQSYLLFQPYSCQSCSYDMHWEHWMPALEWLVDVVDCKIVVVGTPTSIYFPDFVHPKFSHPKIIDMVGKTKSILDVFHIMEGAKGVITTSNSLSMWSILTKKPALVMCNKVIQKTYFYNWINYPLNRVLCSDATLADFKQEFTKIFN